MTQILASDVEVSAVDCQSSELARRSTLSYEGPGGCLGAVVEEHFTVDLGQSAVVFWTSIPSNDTARGRGGSLQLSLGSCE